ncbi:MULTISPECIES: cation diffusion facilitator family transporter [unclassified Spongiibacter]|uniref:cation diffusion facilitator family transporter n=1 Tax=unclassified Spongiibacter TaxID=2631504 RepID=UPI00257FF0A5|nr:MULTISPECIES: cation diffusion facilitator family transporter [unclassified Spongiibacter]
MANSEHIKVESDADNGDLRVVAAIWANGLLTFAQVAGGIYAGSLALVADALHNFSDMAALVIALAARKIARRPANLRMPFGYGRIEVVAALINYTTLIVIGLYLIYEGGMRIFEPQEVAGWTVVIVGAVALIVDLATAALTYSMQKGSVNIRAMFLHNLSDALASIAVVAVGIIVILYDVKWVDPVVTICIATYILYVAFSEIGTPVRTLMLASPPGISYEELVDVISNIEGVVELHNVHLWQLSENASAFDAHIVLAREAWVGVEVIKNEIKNVLRGQFGINHSTLEFECYDRDSPCEYSTLGISEGMTRR